MYSMQLPPYNIHGAACPIILLYYTPVMLHYGLSMATPVLLSTVNWMEPGMYPTCLAKVTETAHLFSNLCIVDIIVKHAMLCNIANVNDMCGCV